MIEPYSAAQIQTFIEEILQPVLQDLQEHLEAPDKLIIIVENADNENQTVEGMLHLMHPQRTYFAPLSNHPSPELPYPQSWICSSLYIEFYRSGYEVEFIPYRAQYCFPLEVTITPSQHVRAASIVGCRDRNHQTFEVSCIPFEADGLPLPLESVDSSDILLRFVETFETFEAELSGSPVEPTDRSKTSDANSIEPITPWPAFIEPEFLDSVPAEPTPQEPNSIGPSFPSSIPADSFPKASLDLDPNVLSPETPAPFPNSSESAPESSPFSLSEILEPAASRGSSPSQSLRRLAKQLSQKLAPDGFPIYSELNPSLPASFQVKPVLDRYQRIVDLSREYSPLIQERDLTEYLSRLGQYQNLRRLAHLHILIQEQVQTWLQKYGYPSLGAIAANLHQRIIEFRDYLDQRVQTLTDQRLEISAHTLQIELDQLSRNNHQRLLDRLEQNPLLGYLDISLLASTNNLEQSVDPFTDFNKPVEIQAHHLKNKEGKILLTLISSCQDEKYQAYLQRKRTQQIQHKFVEYTITQKLYPQRPIFIGPAPKSVHPRLELLWGDAEELTLDLNPFAQIWCIYPINRTDPPRWIIIAATTNHQPLHMMTLADGKTAQEGSNAYLKEGLARMASSEDEYTHILGDLVTTALERKQVKYMHIHQTFNSHTAEPRDILQIQFRLDPDRSH